MYFTVGKQSTTTNFTTTTCNNCCWKHIYQMYGFLSRLCFSCSQNVDLWINALVYYKQMQTLSSFSFSMLPIGRNYQWSLLKTVCCLSPQKCSICRPRVTCIPVSLIQVILQITVIGFHRASQHVPMWRIGNGF